MLAVIVIRAGSVALLLVVGVVLLFSLSICGSCGLPGACRECGMCNVCDLFSCSCGVCSVCTARPAPDLNNLGLAHEAPGGETGVEI